MTMKKALSLILTALMLVSLFAFTGCSSKKSIEDIKKAGKLVVYTEAGFAPYEFIYNNEIVGVDIEIMKAVAAKIGVELEVNDVNFDTICTSVKSGKADVGAAGITINDTRKKTVDFSNPYSSTEQYVVVAAGNDTIKNIGDLKGKSIGVQEGTTSDLLIEKLINDGTLAGSTLTPYKAPAVAAASIGKIDAVVTDKLTAQIIEANNSGKYVAFKLVNADGSDVAEVEEYGIAVSKGSTELLEVINEVIKELTENGSIEKWTQEFTDLANSISEEDTSAGTDGESSSAEN